MDRSKSSQIFLSVLILLLFPLCGCDRESRDIRELKFSFFAPTSHNIYPVIEEWSRDVSRQAGIRITIYAGGSLGKPQDQYENTAKGICDFAYVIPSYTAGKFPLTSAIELPFIIDDCEKASIVLWDTYEKFLREEYKDVKMLWTFVPAPGHIHTAEKPVRTLEDLKGLKIRTPGREMARSLDKLGAVPVTMPITQVYTALERGTIDGVTMPWEIMDAYKLCEQTKYHTEVGLYTLAQVAVMNRNAYESLSPGAKEILDRSIGKEMSRKAGIAFKEAELSGRASGLAQGGEVIPLPPSERERWEEAVRSSRSEWIQEMTDLGLPGEEVLEYIEAALK
jgi:TRAP-type C4-dicarboxylate transport system substrate-binding protein